LRNVIKQWLFLLCGNSFSRIRGEVTSEIARPSRLNT
jgi:hypothetical protein